ncbi:CoA-substrate-specific enzyme activase, putative [Sporobacter termitidis DSM 10068]|uniref:CoA-substrate-specific enzyme activase, putative n=1 Tax=Sporobacter termitidis DSM 10068 TaxID=1123282 RepID=A0A1M5VH46_9FIRM|nr:acyl-CoA dehydratase activase [Sporobacter termitidis]SHH74612.1 CoA-substrate-specific enzyme activase, putative [Sporobacter termitidis DSM 10068]
MAAIGIDIGSTSAKAVVLDDGGTLVFKCIRPTGWSSAEAADGLRGELASAGFDPAGHACVATGYGRLNVPYAGKLVTEITCHARGAAYLFGEGPFTVIDIGGQDTKIISVAGGRVSDFIMNDKCSAGTGRFLEIMANSMGQSPAALIELARQGSGVSISSLCTVFAESEVISLIGQGKARADIAFGIVESIVDKVCAQCHRAGGSGPFYLTGGLCECPGLLEPLSRRLRSDVNTSPLGRYAGAIGAAVTAGTIGKG